MTNPPASPLYGEEEIDKFLDSVFYNHEDSDYQTCGTCYYTCQDCGKRWYGISVNSPCGHPRDRWVQGECDCPTKEDRAEAKSALQALLLRAQIDELDRAQRLIGDCYDGDLDYFNKRLAALQHQLKELEKNNG